jgi:DNA-binding transcriptional MerR regulator
MGEGLLSIGQFSALCRLSPKALRLYDELGRSSG